MKDCFNSGRKIAKLIAIYFPDPTRLHVVHLGRAMEGRPKNNLQCVAIIIIHMSFVFFVLDQ
jgi:hypothetical protein